MSLTQPSCCLWAWQAVVKAEAKPFREARMFLPVLKTATRWAAIEPSWGFARALASELCWLRESGKGAATGAARARAGAPAATAAAAAPPPAAEALEVLAATAAAAVAAPTPAASASAAAPRFGATAVIEPTASIAPPPVAVTGTTYPPAAATTTAAASTALEGRDNATATTATAAATTISYSLDHVASGQGCVCSIDSGGTGDGAAGKAWEPEEGTYCICRGGDYGGVMVSCDACSEWFHASW